MAAVYAPQRASGAAVFGPLFSDGAADVTGSVAGTAAYTITGTGAVAGTVGDGVSGSVAGVAAYTLAAIGSVSVALSPPSVAPDPVGLRLEDDFLPLVVPYVTGCPPQTILQHLLQAWKTFCRRTLAWNYEHTAIPTVAGQAGYTLTLLADTELVKVLGCEVEGGATYTVQNGALGRKFVREAAGRNVCVLAPPNGLTLYPAPPVSGRDLIIDVAIMPSNTAAVWPATLAEHIEYIAAGAVGTLCAMPKVDWRDIDTAADQRDRFERRINAVYHTAARTLVRQEAARQSVQF